MQKLHRILFFAIVSGLVTACVIPRTYEPRGSSQAANPASAANTTGVETQAVAPSESTGPAEVLPTPTAKQRTLSPATKSLVAQAQAQSNAGNDALAAATIERALRIESDNPLLWLELAKIRQNEGNAAQAENLARKTLAMATGDTKTQAAAWRVIAESYRARGRNPEARDADAKATGLAGSG